MTASKSPFPKLSQLWRLARLSGASFAAAAAVGVAHIAWSERAAAVAVAVGAAEAAYRQAFPSGKLSGQLASLVAAYRQITAPTVVPAPAAPAVANSSVPEVPVQAA